METVLVFLLLFYLFESSSHQRLESEWQQVSSSLQNSSLYSNQSQQCCSLDGLPPSSSYFQILQSLCQSFRDSTERANYIWY